MDGTGGLEAGADGMLLRAGGGGAADFGDGSVALGPRSVRGGGGGCKYNSLDAISLMCECICMNLELK